MQPVTLTERELDIMSVLWDLGSGTAAELRERLPDSLAHTTILTMLRVMEEKGYVTRVPEGRAHRYLPLLARADAGHSALSKLLAKVFRNSPVMLLTHLVSERDLSEEELAEMQRLLDASRRDEGAR